MSDNVMKPLWSKGQSANSSELQKRINHFMSGDDVVLDRQLLPYDIEASKAHAEGLGRIGVLTKEEVAKLVCCLTQLKDLSDNGDFVLDTRFEDCHSAIEWFLTEQLGDIGKKIHTGRSRNDQISVATRLYCRDALKQLQNTAVSIAETCLQLAKKHEFDVLPGYTHLQRAVVSSWGMWFASFAESFVDNALAAQQTCELINSNPLGTAAGYGVNLDLDRAYTTEKLGFNRTQLNPIYVQNSRGKIELQVLSCYKNCLLDLRRLSWDLSLFSTAEYGFIQVGDDFSTGSSIMPNKHNPDAVELMRAEYARLVGNYNQLEALLALPSGYQRDLQNTKAPLLNGVNSSLCCLSLVPELLKSIVINKEQCELAVDESMFATDKAVELVIKDGFAFRDAYRHIKDNYDELKERIPSDSVVERKSAGACGNLFLNEIENRLSNIRQ